MHARQRLVVLGSSAILALAMAGPVVAEEPGGPTGSIVIDLHVIGYNVGVWDHFGGQIGCDGLADPVGFDIPASTAEASSEPVVVPADTPCRLADLGSGDPGAYAWWGDPEVVSGEPFSVAAGETAHVDVDIERGWTGDEPYADVDTWYGLDVFTVDRVYLNRSGGITAEGLVLCSSMADVPGFEDYLGIDWDATQYLGRKTAIHGGYRADIANKCFDPAQPTRAQRWTSSHPAGNGAVTAWVYGVDGRFGAGTIHVDAAIGGDLVYMTQYWDSDSADTWDPGCNATPVASGYYDQNGDGFCFFRVFVGERTYGDVRTTAVKGR